MPKTQTKRPLNTKNKADRKALTTKIRKAVKKHKALGQKKKK